MKRLLLLLLLAARTASAQEEPLALDPPLRTVFPLAESPAGIRVEYPVLINDHTVLRPAAILRFVYFDPTGGHGSSHDNDDKSNGFRSHVGPGGALVQGGDAKPPDTGGQAGGWGNNDTDDTAGIYDDTRREDSRQRKKELQNEVWTRPDLFRDALDHATELGTMIVYHLPPQGQPVTAPLDLPEGMLLAEENGHVRVLGLAAHSRAFSGGVRAGDEILSLSGGAPLRTLDDFLREYIATKHQAKISGIATYAMEVERDGQSVAIQIAAPPRMPSLFGP